MNMLSKQFDRQNGPIFKQNLQNLGLHRLTISPEVAQNGLRSKRNENKPYISA